MPDLGNRNVVTDTNGNMLDVVGVGPVPQQVPPAAQSIAQNLASWAAFPGNVYAGQQPQAPGQWSEVDEAIARANLAAQFDWGPETGLLMLGAGGAPADASLAMGRPSIEYLNARRAAKPASGGKTYSRAAKQAPEAEAMTPEELTAAKVKSDWSAQNIAQEAYWDKLFEQFGLERGYSLDETLGSGSRRLSPATTVAAYDPLKGAEPFTGKLPKYAEEMFSKDGATIHKLQKPGRYPTYVATSPTGEAYRFKDFEKAKQWADPPPVQRPEPADPNELPPWVAALVLGALASLPGRARAETEAAGREPVPLYRGGKDVTPRSAPPRPHERLEPIPEGGPKSIHSDIDKPSGS